MSALVFLLWWTFDDWLAGALGQPGLGEVPLILAVVVLAIFASITDRELVNGLARSAGEGFAKGVRRGWWNGERR